MPRQQQARERGVINLLQKVGRGYLARKRIQHDRDNQKMELTFEYFENIKRNYEFNAGLILAYYMKKHLKKMKAKRAKAAAAKAAKSKKGGKFGKTAKAVAKATTIAPKPAPAKAATLVPKKEDSQKGSEASPNKGEAKAGSGEASKPPPALTTSQQQEPTSFAPYATMDSNAPLGRNDSVVSQAEAESEVDNMMESQTRLPVIKEGDAEDEPVKQPEISVDRVDKSPEKEKIGGVSSGDVTNKDGEEAKEDNAEKKE